MAHRLLLKLAQEIFLELNRAAICYEHSEFRGLHFQKEGRYGEFLFFVEPLRSVDL